MRYRVSLFLRSIRKREAECHICLRTKTDGLSALGFRTVYLEAVCDEESIVNLLRWRLIGVKMRKKWQRHVISST